ncbi:MAG: histone deacetylase [Chitinivibrionales bacterium]|nr:histone deacetylase [Chitinivibrionales bacterium]MBD3396079.1 histone deacetylase [Chitinivibrionales bacterium]
MGLAPLACDAHTNAPSGSKNTGYVYDKRYLDHVLSAFHPESPERLTAIEKKLKETGLIDEMRGLPLLADPMPAIGMVHSESHIANIGHIPTTGGIAPLAVAGALGAVKAVGDGTVRNAFCALRPPGHHALNTGREEGFCFFNNIAIAARYAQRELGFEKVLIIDWDYHHGNGTEWAFYDDPSVLFFSTHDWRAYPGTGDPKKRGQGAGEGFTINVHLGCGADDDDMYRAWDDKLLPAAQAFKPDIVLISAGFDSRKEDTLGCFDLTDLCFSRMTKMAMGIADAHCDGRLVSLLEGGYNVYGLAEAVAAHVMTLTGKA